MSASSVETFITDVGSLLDGLATPDQRTRIEHALADDPALVDLYRELVQIDAVLNWRHRRRPLAIATDKPHTSAPHADAEPAPGEASGTPGTSPYPIYRKGHEPNPRNLHPRHYAVAAIAATLLAACGVAIYLLAFNADPSDIEPRPSNIEHPPLATLIHSSGGTLTTPHGFPAEGDDYGRGEYSLTSGGAEFMLTNAVNVKLRGNTRMTMRNPMNVALTRGSAAFVVPPDATGFTVHLPDGSRIVDLGTSFRVTLDDDGRAHVRVSKGLVEVIGTDGQSAKLAPDRVGEISDGQLTTTPLTAHLAYGSAEGTVGTQDNFNGALGLDFAIDRTVTVTHLGTFDSGSDGLTRPINVRLYERDDAGTPDNPADDRAGRLVAQLTLEGDEGTLEGGHRIVQLDEPLDLPAGFNGTIVASGYGAGEPNGNRLRVAPTLLADPNRWTTDAGDGVIRFLPTVRFGQANTWPVTIDAGSRIGAVYAAGTFRYTAETIDPDPIVSHPETPHEDRP